LDNYIDQDIDEKVIDRAILSLKSLKLVGTEENPSGMTQGEWAENFEAWRSFVKGGSSATNKNGFRFPYSKWFFESSESFSSRYNVSKPLFFSWLCVGLSLGWMAILFIRAIL